MFYKTGLSVPGMVRVVCEILRMKIWRYRIICRGSVVMFPGILLSGFRFNILLAFFQKKSYLNILFQACSFLVLWLPFPLLNGDSPVLPVQVLLRLWSGIIRGRFFTLGRIGAIH
jgi:hypothetical protein